MRIIIAGKQVKKIDWELSAKQLELTPDRPGVDEVQVDIVFEYDPDSPSNVRIKQILSKRDQTDLFPHLPRFYLAELEREVTEKVSRGAELGDDPFFQSRPNKGRGPFDDINFNAPPESTFDNMNMNTQPDNQFKDIF